jgi:hypothetical protein
MRVSHLRLPTVKEDPAGAEAVSHKLMVRVGLVRHLGPVTCSFGGGPIDSGPRFRWGQESAK